MLGLLDTVIALLVFAGFALFSFMKHRARERQPDEDSTDLPPLPGRPIEGERRRTWEDELRELLETRPAQPPPIVRRVPEPAPLVFVPETPRSTDHRHIPVPQPAPHREIEPYSQTPELTRASHRFHDAGSLQQRVERHMELLSHPHSAVASVHYHEPSADAKRAVEMMRNPRDLRSAMIASLILGPPKALAD